MNILDEVQEIGKSVLTQHYKFLPNSELDDLSNIFEIKVVIEGISEYLKSKNYTANDIKSIKKNLINFAEKSFIEHCAKAAIDVGDAPDEALDREYFKYIFKTGKYPE